MAVDDVAALMEGASAVIDLVANDTDVDGDLDPSTVVVVAAPTVGFALVQSTGEVEYFHDGSESPSDSFTYTVSDLAGNVSNEAVVQVQVTLFDDGPDAIGDSADVQMFGSVNIDVLANDVDDYSAIDPTSVVVAVPPAHGTTFVEPDGTITYTQDGTATTFDSFFYTVEDTTGNLSNFGQVFIGVRLVLSVPETLLALRGVDDTLVEIDPVGFTETDIGIVGVGVDAGGMAWDPVAKALFLVVDDGAGSSLHRLDPGTGQTRSIGPTVATDAVAATWDGSTDTLYALDALGTLHSVDTGTGLETPIGATGLGPEAALAWDSTADRLLAVDGGGSVWELDRSTGAAAAVFTDTRSLQNPGATWDPSQDVLWVGSEGSALYGVDLAGNTTFDPTPVPSGSFAALAWIPERSVAHVGTFDVSDGPLWSTNPPVYSCVETCALLYGGDAADYDCSTDVLSVDHLAYAAGFADPTFCFFPNTESFEVDPGSGYNCGSPSCSYSAYVDDSCVSAVNNCWR